MNAPVDTSCPPWCDQPAGHLHVETAGPGDYHISEFTLVDLPEIPGIREGTAIQVAIEQYVTSTTTYDPLISLGLGDDDPDSEALTLDEADTLATTISRAVTAARDAQTRQSPNDDSPA
ncbi:DUF6907 domain-containing protein [Protofrankia symbiont of Coriaria ruscifolia]|uniref:DUF6907 domain-containing protein n=1 Tax=Protofrankia symbiont of Coriaria ruscifolia TaxID=1306542 RepID=UPI001041A1EA|nr:hypothetical protein [Protofrankia symbiont of Coriaria ruscifolia]